MPPRKRKQQLALEQQHEKQGEGSEQQLQPDRAEVARRIQERLEALDRAGERWWERWRGLWLSGTQVEASSLILRLSFPPAVEAKCQAIMDAAEELVDGFMQDFKIRLKTSVPPRVRCALAHWRMSLLLVAAVAPVL